jgi:hypothetical protein
VELTPRTGLSSRVVDGERVILDRDNDTVHQLNSTASLIWDALSDGRSASEIAAELADRFEVGETEAMDDVLRIVRELDALDLIDSSEFCGTE